MDFLYIRLIHIFVLGLFLLWVGVAVPQQPWLYPVLLLLGLFLLIYWLVTLRRQDVFWIVWHLLVGLVLIWIGVTGHGSPRSLFRLLVIIGVAAIGYHLVGLVRDRLARA
ncbi:hypothetical protein EBZ80_22035 [bacterium]|nr:hypothetical protein [bacterium]